MFIGQKAQSSFEMVIISAITVSLAYTALSQLPKITMSTGALGVLKSEILSEFSKYDKFYYIESINSPEWNDTTKRTEIESFLGGNDITQITENVQNISDLLQDLNLCTNCRVVVRQAGK